MQKGYSLVELIAVILLVSILSAVALSRSDNGVFRLQAARDDVIAGLFYAQQIAIARGDASTIQFVSGGSSVTVRENGADLTGAVGYPLSLPAGMSLSPTATLSYDKLGRTATTTFTLTDTSGNSATITVEATGYAH